MMVTQKIFENGIKTYIRRESNKKEKAGGLDAMTAEVLETQLLHCAHFQGKLDQILQLQSI